MGEIGTAFGGVPTPDPLAQFLGRVLAWSEPGEPDTYVNIHAFTPKRDVEARGTYARRGGGRAYASMVEYGELSQFLWQLNRDGDEVFFCLSTRSGFKGQDQRGNRKASRSRKAGNLPVRLKAFVLDLDVKARGYASQRAALAAVLPVFDRWGIKPTIVDTGWGLHAYITLAERITPAVWQPLANALIEAAKQAGLKFDVAVTRDDDRILRLPTSFNRKVEGQEKICRLLALGVDIPLADLEQILAPYRGISAAVPTRANGHAPRLDLSFLPPRPPITRGPDVERVRADREHLRVVTSVDLLLGACPVVADSDWRGGNGDREPLWFELAKLCHYVENGRDLFHDLSSDDPRYDEDQTDAKYDQAEPQGWPACATIAAASEDAERICRTCSMYGKGQSPIHAATRGDPPGEAPSGQANGHVNGHDLSAGFLTATAGPALRPIWLPEPFLYENNFILTPDKLKVYRTPILDITPRYDHDNGAHKLVLDFKILRGTKDADDTGIVSVPAGALAMRNKAAEAMMTGGLIPNTQLQEMFMPSLLDQIRDKKLAVTRERTGWIGDTKQFAYGGRIYTADGPRDGGRPDSAYLEPHGNLDDWRVAANKFVGRGFVEMEIIMACGYTGPLVPMGTTPGVFLYVFSADSGRGKSAAMDCACSVAANPLAVVKTSTVKASTNRVAQYNNIPVHFDELVPDDPKTTREFAAMIKTIVSGAGTTRLNRAGKEVPTLTSRNQVVGCGNKRMTEVARSPDTNAQAARIVEFEIPNRLADAGITEVELVPVRRAIEQNYGVAMPVYIDFVVRNYDQVQAMVVDTIGYLERKLHSKNPQRFWINQIAVIMVAARIARKLNLQAFDVTAIDQFLIDWFVRHSAEVFDADASADDPGVQLQKVRYFYNDHLRNRLITDHMPKPGRGQTTVKNAHDLQNVKEFVIRLAVIDRRMRISESKLKTWCSTKGISYDHLKAVLRDHGYCEHYRKGKSIGGGCGDAYHTAQEPLLDFDLSDPRNAGFIEEQAA